MNETQNKSHTTENEEINKISLSCFVDKIYILKNGTDALALHY